MTPRALKTRILGLTVKLNDALKDARAIGLRPGFKIDSDLETHGEVISSIIINAWLEEETKPS